MDADVHSRYFVGIFAKVFTRGAMGPCISPGPGAHSRSWRLSKMQHSIVRLEHCTVSRSGIRLVDDISFSWEAGTHWAVLGENGAGKSTLLKLLRGELPPDAGGTRTYWAEGEEQNSPIGLRERMGLVAPHLQESLETHGARATGREAVLGGFFDTPLLYQEPSPAQEAAADSILEELHLTELAEMPLAELSTGQVRRLMVARALVVEPKALILDEPLDGLDAEARVLVAQCIDKAAMFVPVVCAAHRLADIPDVVTDMLFLEHGKVALSGLRQEVEPRVRKREMQHVLRVRKGGRTCPANANGADTCDLPFLFSLRGVEVMRGERRILHVPQWDMKPGEHWAVTGSNGAGKSTFLGLLSGETVPSSTDNGTGTVRLFGRAPGVEVVSQRRRVGHVSPRMQTEFPYDLPVHEVVASGFFSTVGLYEQLTTAEEKQVEKMLQAFGLEELRERTVRSLSTGQFRRALLARAVVGGPDVLLLDEPLSGLDRQGRDMMLELVEHMAEDGVHLVYVTHRADEMPACINRVLGLVDGRVASSGARFASSA